MKKIPASPRITKWTVAVAAFGLVLGTTTLATGHLMGAYAVPSGKSTNGNHFNADYLVFDTGSASDAGLFFMEKTGPFRFMPFNCDDAIWSAADEAYSCSRIMPLGGIAIEETVTVGEIDGPFCDELRDDHNPPAGPTKIMEPDECGPGEQCSCYEINHRCWDGSGYDAVCATPPDPPNESDRPDAKRVRAPPGDGAGSGKRH